jgi:hypothetical protein
VFVLEDFACAEAIACEQELFEFSFNLPLTLINGDLKFTHAAITHEIMREQLN